MYLEHYGLKLKPFELNPDPKFLFFSHQHKLAYSMLEYGLLSQPGITVITGTVGSGKTTLLRHLLEQHNDEDLRVGFLADTDSDTAKHLYQWIAMSFGLDHAVDMITLKKQFQDFLIDSYAKGKSNILIVDEAQNLSKKSLEQLRLLNNINTGEDELIKIILVGQPELVKKLQSPGLMQFAQRVTVEFHLEPLCVEQAPQYVKHRLEQAGTTRQIFDESGIYSIYYFAGGVPRLINMLCEYTLVYGYSKGLTTLGLDAVLEVIRGRKIGGIASIQTVTADMDIARQYIQEVAGVDLQDVA